MLNQTEVSLIHHHADTCHVCVCTISVNDATCEFVIGWETHWACAVKQQKVTMVNGTVQVPETGVSINLGVLYFR